MHHPRNTLTLAALLAILACGPPRLGSGPSEGETGSDPTSSSSESTTGTEETTTEEPAETESGPMPTTGAYIPVPDTVEIVLCNPFMQDCPEGEKCVPFGSRGGTWYGHKCVPIMGDQEPGEPCWYGGPTAATDNCDEAGACWYVTRVDGELMGTCHAFCGGTPDDPYCPPSSSCQISSEGSIVLCIPNCDPTLQDCGPGLACYWGIGGFHCIFTTQDIPAGQPCGYINDCAVGLGCLNADVMPDCNGSACCSPFCDLELGDAQCEAVPGTVCASFFEENMAPPGYDHVGVCILP